MCLIQKFIEELQEYLTGSKLIIGNIIRKHSKKLDELGDLSFPLNLKNWSQIIDKSRLESGNELTIFDYLLSDQDLNLQLQSLVKISENWSLVLESCKLKNNSDVHLYLNRFHTIELCIRDVLISKNNYGIDHKCIPNKVSVICDNVNSEESGMNLTELRLRITQDVLLNILNHLARNDNAENVISVQLTLNSNKKQNNVIVCGSVLNETGVKDTQTTAAELYKKRSLDMQLMAQHKYGIQVKPLPSWLDYFSKLGRASVTIEMLQNKTHKATKITLNSLQSSNKGPSFIFYNCARLSALFKEFYNRVADKVYPDLPSIDNIDFTLLNQPEEWELIFVYVLQFPVIVSNCVCDITSGNINVHILALFLSNLSSVFSAYYRRVKILMNPKDHLFPLLHARIYLLKAVQQVFHTALYLLNIEPIKEM